MNILITGASRGIGAALTEILAAEGHRVFLVSRNEKKLEELADRCNRSSGAKLAVPLPFDLTELPDEEEFFLKRITAYTGTLDGLVNNAGQLVNRPFKESSLEEARRVFEINFFIPAMLIRLCLPLLEKSTLKHVVNMSSMGGYQGSAKFPGLSFYSASKAALGNLSECLAEELKGEGIKVNSLAIGAVQTEMLAEAFPGLKAPMEPHEMARFLRWFLMEGGSFFNGKVLPVSVSTP